jgi:hypothetical protein
MTSLAEGHGLIVCYGRMMDEVCAAAIAEIARRHPEYHLRFVMSDWIAPDQLASAAVFWVVDPAAGLANIAPALQHGIPLLVPESSSALKQACIQGNYGLFYQTEAEAAACLIYLVSNPATRNVLARNAAASAATAGTR